MYKILITTSDNISVLEEIAKECILHQKISPCAHIINNVKSLYVWEDSYTKQSEYILLIKCKEQFSDDIKALITDKHNYETPELLSIDFDIASEKYKEWFDIK